jgi:hypothetical protein
MQPQIIVGIPGLWKTRAEIVQSIVLHSGGLIFAGAVILNTKTNEGYELHVYEHDPRMAKAFSIAGQGRISQQAIDLIGSHTFTLYCIIPNMSIEGARKMLGIVNALLKCGGLAAKVETSGVAHSAERWKELNDGNRPFDLYYAFVTLIGNSETFYSCGMHNFGLPDACITSDLQPNEAANLLNHFNLYVLAESPKLNDGHTFSIGQNQPRFVVRKEECRFFPKDDYFFNRQGVWHLEQV